LLRQKKVTKEKATPTSPKPRSLSLPSGRQRTRPAFAVLILFFVSVTQTPLPLIRPTDSDFGGAERGESQNQVGDDGDVYDYYLSLTHPRNNDCALRELTMTPRQIALIALSLTPVVLVIGIAIMVLGYSWKLNTGIEYRTTNYPAVEQRAKVIDHAAGIPPEAHNSATALARIMKADIEAEAGHMKVLATLGFVLLSIAALQIIFLIRPPITRVRRTG